MFVGRTEPVAHRACFRLWHTRKRPHPRTLPWYGFEWSVARRAWVDRPAAGVTLSRKGAKSRTGGRKLRSTGTKAKTRAVSTSQVQPALIKKLRAHADDLEKKLEARTRELAGAREHL